MKIKNVKIGIRSLESGLKEFAKIAEAIEQGKPVKRKKPGIYFEDINTMRKVLTEKRISLLKVIKEKHPSSIDELSRMTKRNFKNVSNDLNYLAEIGLVELKKGKNKTSKVTPIVNYDKILFEIAV